MQEILEQPDRVIIPPQGETKAVVIWLHGLGANGFDFVPAVPALQLPENHGIEFIFPHAPQQTVTLNFGMKMPAWYDIYGLDANAREDEIGLKKAAENLYHLIHSIMRAKKLSSEKIILVGFSQGAALALYAGLRFSEKLGGIAALSGYLPLAKKLAEERHPENHQTKIFLAHGEEDFVVPFEFGKLSYQYLKQLNYSVSFHAYLMAHTVCPEELINLKEFFIKIFSRDN